MSARTSDYRQYELLEAGRFSPTLNDSPTYAGMVETADYDATGYLAEYEFRCRHAVPVGAYRFRGVEVTGAWMLLSNDCCSAVHSSLNGMGWSPAHIEMTLAGETVQAIRADTLSFKPLRAPSVLLSFPGAFTYGHGLVDLSLRLQLARVLGLLDGRRILLQGPTPDWFLPLLAVAGVSLDDCTPIHDGESYYCEEVFVPTIASINGVLNRDLATFGFRRMKETMNNILGPVGRPDDVIFPLHTTMSSIHHPRGVERRDEIVATLERRFGAVAFDPLELTFAQQVDRFRRARLVIGEDSSALHNILWSDGADLAVMAPRGRHNFYHIGIQSVNGGRCAVQWGDVSDPESGRYRIDLDAFCRTLEVMMTRSAA